MASEKMRLYYDGAGILISITCAIHCIVLPLFLSSLSLLSIEFLENKWVEWTMMLAALLFGIISLYHGYRRHHRKSMPIVLFVAGYCLMVLNQATLERFIHLLVPAAAISIVTAHVLNICFTRRISRAQRSSFQTADPGSRPAETA
ncbi:MerC domain-containing protein [Flavihumibacter solisilvae]|uniref:MerC domain-containing protein n=1 Tax=Flavihumibacter solisilvae TaxID=1349421 RepID=UPI000907AE36|nr:MerC domain-containing protein [Flavihumibacter solisilvae]